MGKFESERQRAHAKHLRSHQTVAERNLWYNLRAHRLEGYKFRRQCPIGPYIVDFVCLRAMLIVELDGGQHAQAQRYDARRDAFLEGQGYRVLRFWNQDMLTNKEFVLQSILRELRMRRPSP